MLGRLFQRLGHGLRRLFGILGEALRRYFVAGLLIFAPVGVTIWAIAAIVRWLDQLLLPRVLELVTGIDEPPSLPVVGALFTLLVIIFFGIVARHLFGGELIRAWERILARVPVARSIYGGVKQLFEAILQSSNTSSFRRVVLIEYPRKGVYALAFTTGPARGIVQNATPGNMINCFVPTTPNPTSGYYVLVPDSELTEVELSVEDAFKLIMSAGLVTPESVKERADAKQASAPVAQPAATSGR